jgi:EmrB/QacA subfamily drug resistance transporter
MLNLPARIKSMPYHWVAFYVVAMGTFVSVADTGASYVALPSISDHFLADLPTVQWVTIGFALTVSALLLPMGRLSDLVGRKRVYQIGLLVFIVSGVISAVSPNIPILIFSRVIMGVGAAMTQSTGMAMIVSVFPASERGKAMGLQLGAVGAGAIVGPSVGGFLVDLFGWRGVFYAAALAAAAAFAVAQPVLKEQLSGERQKFSFDWAGAALSIGFLVAFLMVMTNSHRVDWNAFTIIGIALGMMALLYTFVWRELKARSPMMDIRLFQKRLFSMSVTASFITFAAMQSVRFLAPFYIQAVLGYSPQQMGLILVPSALGTIIMGPIGGRLSDRYGWTVFNVIGLTLIASGLFMLAFITPTSGLWHVMVGMIIMNAGAGTFNSTNNTAVISTVERSKYGVVSGFLNLVRNSANVTGIAIATAVVTMVMAADGHPPTLAGVERGANADLLRSFTDGLRMTYLGMGAITAVSIFLSFAKGGQTKEAPAEAPAARPAKASSAADGQ